MSAATSPGTGLAYGLRRVCAAWGMARSSFYAMTSGQHAEQPPAKRRGPKPAISDQALLVAIEADLEASPWEGEGYRKVWARLRVCRDIRVARKRVLRLMRENNLLSPHRCRRRGGNPHAVRSSLMPRTSCGAPMAFGCSRWTTAGAGSSPPSSLERRAWHVCKRGDRFAALQPISMGLAGLYGSTAAGAARGLALRMDHGSQYLSDHFTNQIKFPPLTAIGLMGVDGVILVPAGRCGGMLVLGPGGVPPKKNWLVGLQMNVSRQSRATKTAAKGRDAPVYRLRNLPQERDHIVEEVICYVDFSSLLFVSVCRTDSISRADK